MTHPCHFADIHRMAQECQSWWRNGPGSMLWRSKHRSLKAVAGVTPYTLKPMGHGCGVTCLKPWALSICGQFVEHHKLEILTSKNIFIQLDSTFSDHQLFRHQIWKWTTNSTAGPGRTHQPKPVHITNGTLLSRKPERTAIHETSG